MFLILIITITFTLAARIPEPCCSKKTVGDLSYTLVNSEDTSIASRYGCKSNCVYQQDDSPGALFCFAVGDLPTNCADAVSVTASTTLTTTTKSAITTEEDAVLIVGGTEKSSEVFFPRTSTSCIVEDYEFPGGVRYHTLNTLGEKTILCGGENSTGGISAECYELTPNSPTAWTKYADLNNAKHLHITWESSQGLVITGGWQSHRTSELVNGDLSFPIHSTRRSCGITDTETDSVIVTGGCCGSENNKVFRYYLNGLIEELPTMNRGRQFHGCGSFKDEETNKMVLIVAGGWSNDTTEKHLGDVTTEKHVIGEDSWKTISPLPKKFWTHSLGDAIVSMNNKIYIFGGTDSPENNDILEYDDVQEGWKDIGKMKVPRVAQATAPIKADQDTLCGTV